MRIQPFAYFAPVVLATVSLGCSSSSPTVGVDAGVDSAAPACADPLGRRGRAGRHGRRRHDADADPVASTPTGTVPPTPERPRRPVRPGTRSSARPASSGRRSTGPRGAGGRWPIAALFSVACEDNSHGWASGTGGFVAHTSDGGGTWTVQNSQLTSDLHAINFGWSTTGVVAGDSGALAVTRDGQTWTAVAPLTNVNLRGAAVAPYVGVMLVVGDAGTVLRSADSGTTWTRASIAGAGDLHGIASDAWAGTVLAVDSTGAIWSSRDEGVTFAREASAGAGLDAVSITQAGTRALAVGKGGVVLARSTTGTWATLSTGSAVDLHAALVDQRRLPPLRRRRVRDAPLERGPRRALVARAARDDRSALRAAGPLRRNGMG